MADSPLGRGLSLDSTLNRASGRPPSATARLAEFAVRDARGWSVAFCVWSGAVTSLWVERPRVRLLMVDALLFDFKDTSSSLAVDCDSRPLADATVLPFRMLIDCALASWCLKSRLNLSRMSLTSFGSSFCSSTVLSLSFQMEYHATCVVIKRAKQKSLRVSLRAESFGSSSLSVSFKAVYCSTCSASFSSIFRFWLFRVSNLWKSGRRLLRFFKAACGGMYALVRLENGSRTCSRMAAFC